MKFVLLLCVMVATVLADEKYTNKYDDLDVHEIIENDRLLMAYFNCIMERGKCTPEGKELRDHLQDAIMTGCSKCTERQQEGAETVIEYLIKNKIDLWNELCAKYDPEGVWRKKYEERAKAKGIEIPK